MRKIILTIVTATLAWLVNLVFRHHRSILPERMIGSMLVVGTDRFASVAANSLRLLQLHDKHGYHLVTRFLRAIVGKESEQQLGYVIGVHFEVVYPTGETAWDTKRIAACLVRSAVQARLLTGHKICSRIHRARLVALRRELRAMEMLECNAEQIDEQRTFIGDKDVPPAKAAYASAARLVK